ncbi:MAG: hypothetical protein ABII82_05440 [Verrucomicrobiota bacterium]
MKTQIESGRGKAGATDGIKTRRFQIYRQAHAGSYVSGFQSDSASEAIVAFLSATPIFEGGELRIWDRREQKVAASVLWGREKTDFGFAVRHRINAFHDPLLGRLARLVQRHEAEREAIRRQMGIHL